MLIWPRLKKCNLVDREEAAEVHDLNQPNESDGDQGNPQLVDLENFIQSLNDRRRNIDNIEDSDPSQNANGDQEYYKIIKPEESAVKVKTHTSKFVYRIA